VNGIAVDVGTLTYLGLLIRGLTFSPAVRSSSNVSVVGSFLAATQCLFSFTITPPRALEGQIRLTASPSGTCLFAAIPFLVHICYPKRGAARNPFSSK
jgi:hypothetical protein